jgi:uracil-DNA glycosylase family 4
MFTGDKSGDWLYRTLYNFGFANQPTSANRMDGLTLVDCYVTASARCAPPDNKPAKDELANCRPYLLHELALLRRVKVVVALGRIAFVTYLVCRRTKGVPRLENPLRFGHGLLYHLPEGITLIASYHPSQQNTSTGRLTQPMFDAVFRQARRWVGG